jgi:ADP-ribose pyrophosphatase YjhB (NUDIX family)
VPAAYEHSAGGLVVRAGKVLLVQVENLKGEIVWCLPKGHLEEGETAEQAALREVEEETGWRCRVVEKLERVHYFFKRQGKLVSKDVDWFVMAAGKKVGTPDAVEVRAVKWAPLEKARELLKYPSDLKMLEKWEKTHERDQD